MAGVGPQSELDGLLAAQMLAVHCATITAASRAAKAEYLDHLRTYVGLLTRLAATFT